MGLEPNEAHIANFDAKQCQLLIEYIKLELTPAKGEIALAWQRSMQRRSHETVRCDKKSQR
jgi:hypothetical protein